MAGFRFNRRSTIRPRFQRRSYRRTSYRAGTNFVARKYNRPVNGRSVPYYLGPGTEAHIFDTAIAFATPAPGPVPTNSLVFSTLLNPIARGTGIFERESQRASMKYIMLRLRCSLNDTIFPLAGSRLISGPITIRYILVYAPRQLATITVTDFLTPVLSTASIATAGVQRIDSRENFQIIYDNKFIIRQSNGNSTTGPNAGLVPLGDFTFRDLDIKVAIRRPVTFTATSTTDITLSDITSGSLHLFAVVDNSYATNMININTSIAGSARLVFTP